MEETTVQTPSVFGNLASVEIVHKLDTNGLLMNALILAAIYAGFEILKLVIANALTK